MIKSQIPLNNESYLVTASLLNSWMYIFDCVDNVKEAQSDEISLEDKASLTQEKAYNDFLKTLRREPIETNIYMQRGIEFEDECYKGNTIISPIIEGGAYQIVGVKHKTINGIDFVLYGRLDVLKAGIIYDIKRVSAYKTQKYFKSSQHSMYLELFENAYEFKYLIYDGNALHIETYYREENQLDEIIKNFINWLTKNNLLKLYKEKWKSIERKEK